MSFIRTNLAICLLCLTCTASAEISLTLKKSFVEKYKNRTTITAECTVDHSKGKPNPASKDGDMHIAVRCQKDIGLPAVAEIMNAKEALDAVNSANQLESSQEKTKITGAWRIWNEHGGDESFKQGDQILQATNSNPDHVFEIHPISDFGGIDLSASFKKIEGYDAKKAEDAFHRYENTRSRIRAKGTNVTIESPGLGYNYVEFQMELYSPPFPVDDGAFAYAKVRDWDGELIHRKKRMVFVKGTPPEVAVRGGTEGNCWRVLGIPRVDLALVSWRVKNSAKRPEILDWNLPYEIIVVAVYAEQCARD